MNTITYHAFRLAEVQTHWYFGGVLSAWFTCFPLHKYQQQQQQQRRQRPTINNISGHNNPDGIVNIKFLFGQGMTGMIHPQDQTSPSQTPYITEGLALESIFASLERDAFAC